MAKANKTEIATTDQWTDGAAYAALTGVVYVLTGIPLPPMILKNVTKAACSLVTSSANLGRAKLDAMAQALDDEREATAAERKANSIVMLAAAKAAAKQMGKSPELGVRAAEHMLNRYILEQENRETIGQLACAELAAQPPRPEEDAASEIDDDWLNMFARLAETKSSEDMRVYFARILAGEIRKPGSFSPATIQLLSTLSPRTAMLFQRLCGFVAESEILPLPDDQSLTDPFVLVQPYGRVEANSFGPLGLGYMDFARLREAGLLHIDFGVRSAKTTQQILDAPVRVGRRRLLFRRTARSTTISEIGGAPILLLSRAGGELFRIANVTPNEAYIAKLVAHARELGFDLADSESE